VRIACGVVLIRVAVPKEENGNLPVPAMPMPDAGDCASLRFRDRLPGF
jgi:hypothetical protein